MADPSTQRERFSTVVQALPLAHKVAMGAAVAVVGIAALFFYRWISEPSYSVLASGVDATELADITTELDRLGVSYQIEAAGSRVMVQRGQLGTARAGLGAAGITTEDTGERAGYELLDDQGLAVSSNLERVNVQRALEGELSRTLRELERVTTATVHLVVPDSGLFGDPLDAEASVIVGVPADFTISEADAVANIVAGAVENLAADDVTIVDLQGRTLRAATDGTDGFTANGRDVLRTVDFEQRLEGDITRLLLSAGAGDRATVMVRADLNFDQIESRTETFDPETQIPLRESSTNESFTGPGSAAPGGVAGVDGVETDTENSADEINYEKTDTATEYGVDSVITNTVTAPGEIESLHIGVVVDDGTVTGATVPSAETLTELIAAGIGVQFDRGDTLVVTATPFPAVEPADPDAAPLTAAETPEASSPLDLLPQAIGAIAILAAAIGLFMMSRGRGSNPDAAIDPTNPAALGAGPTGPSDAGTAAGAAGTAGALGAASSAEGGAVTTITEDNIANAVNADVIDLVQRQPEDMAALLRAWLAEG